MSDPQSKVTDMLQYASIVDSDYVNEYGSLHSRIMHALLTHGHAPREKESDREFLARTAGEVVMRAIKSVRATGVAKVRTVAERLLDPNSRQAVKDDSPSHKILRAEIESEPEKIRQLDGVAHILNTTLDYDEFKAAFTQGLTICGRKTGWDR